MQIWLKWFWVTAVVVALLWYLHGRWWGMLEALENFTLLHVLSSMALLLLAKLALSEVAYVATQATGQFLGRQAAYGLYNISQLGKYIPGSIWQYAGRGAGYRLAGASYAQTANAILLETIWVVGGAALVGTILSGPTLLGHAVRNGVVSSEQVSITIGIFLTCVAVLAFGMILYRRRLRQIRRVLCPHLKVIILQISIWCLLGLSFGLLVKGAGNDIPVIYIIGLFAIAYAIGFIVIFAPAGLGAREGALILGLGPYMPVEKALVTVLVARMVYLFSELILAGLFVRLGFSVSHEDKGSV